MVYIILILSMFHVASLFKIYRYKTEIYIVYITLIQNVFHVSLLAVFLIIFYEHVCNNKYVAVCALFKVCSYDAVV